MADNRRSRSIVRDSGMTNLNISVEASNDLQEIKRYISEDLNNPIAANSTVLRITKAIHTLETFPDIGAPLASIIELPTDYRFLVCGNYLVFYRQENGEVYIIRVIYGKRDYINVLFGETQFGDSCLEE